MLFCFLLFCLAFHPRVMLVCVNKLPSAHGSVQRKQRKGQYLGKEFTEVHGCYTTSTVNPGPAHCSAWSAASTLSVCSGSPTEMRM